MLMFHEGEGGVYTELRARRRVTVWHPWFEVHSLAAQPLGTSSEERDHAYFGKHDLYDMVHM
jgi:hypothetical protein